MKTVCLGVATGVHVEYNRRHQYGSLAEDLSMLTPDSTFAGLIERVRARDQQAAQTLVERWTCEIRVCVRRLLRRTALGPVFQEEDVIQEVWGRFFARTHTDGLVLDRPEALISLLAVIARNFVRDRLRRLHVRGGYCLKNVGLQDELPGDGACDKH